MQNASGFRVHSQTGAAPCFSRRNAVVKTARRTQSERGDRPISEHHLQQALAGSSVVNSLCKCSLSGSVQRAATVPHDQTCDVPLKGSLHEWMNVGYTHADVFVHMRDSV